MAQEENAQKHSNSSSGGGGGSRSYRKMKQKKVPQRGLGVAQLEKIRLEEQHKKEATLQNGGVLTPNPVISPSNSSSSLGVQCTAALRPTISAASSIPLLPPPSPNDIPSPNCMFRTAPSIPIVDILGPNSVPLSKSLNVSSGGVGGGIGWGAVPGQGPGNWPRAWNGEYNLEGENLRLVDHQGFSLPSDVNLGYESTAPFLHLPNFAQGPQHFQPSSPSSSLMNVSTGISSSSVLNFPMEPPSNQNFCGSKYRPLWPDEEKMIGMKRPYSFSMETPPAPAFHLKYPPCYGSSISRMDEPASSSNRCAVSTDPGVIRDVPAKSSIVSQHPREEAKENLGLNGDFLSLGPPAPCYLQMSSRYNQVLVNSGHQRQGLFDFGSQLNQGGNEDSFPETRSSKSMRTTFFSFLSSTKKQTDQNAALVDNCDAKASESIDLSLKL